LRVLHVHSGNIYGGIERALETMAMVSKGEAAPAPELAVCFDGRLAAGWRAAGLVPHVLGPARLAWPASVWHARRRLGALLRARTPDAIVCHSSWTRVIFGGRIGRAGVPLILWQHSAGPNLHWLDRLAARVRPQLVLYNSQYTQSTMRHAYAGIPGAVLYCPVQAPPRATSAQRSALRHALATADDAIVVVQASRLERWKGHSDLIAALGELRHDERWVLWIAGARGGRARRYVAALDAQARDLEIRDRVRFLGEWTDVPGLLAAADVYCQPNTHPEPFGIAFVEALHAGLPVVTTAAGGALEIIDESCGILTEPGDRWALAEALRLLVRDVGLRRHLGRGGPERARQLCDPSVQVQRLRMVLREVVEHRSVA
jgi:glycosyltransferase involved in cell wall biosynthesis